MSENDTKMNPEVKAKWLERLRSGTIPQVVNVLAEKGGGPGRCCLGVLCDIAVEEGVIGPSVTNEFGQVEYAGDRACLPPEVMAWSGVPNRPRWEDDTLPTELALPSPVRYVSKDGVGSGTADTITTLNDFSNLGFAGIADIIEEQL